MTRKSVLGFLVPVAAVLAVHGTNLNYPLFYDDYHWLSISDHPGWFAHLMIPETGASPYRPGLGLWFVGMQALFGLSALPYHLVALAFLAAAALAVRWFCLELGLGNLAGTASGALYGGYAVLTLTTIWMSAAGSPLGVALAVSSIALVCQPSARRQVLAAAVLAAAIIARDSTVVTPALATLVLAARSPARLDVKTALRSTRSIWLVAGAFLAVRLVRDLQGSNTGAYAVHLFGKHVPTNLLDLMRIASRFGLPEGAASRIRTLLPVWDVLFWLFLFAAAAWALRRRSYLPLAGIAWFFVAVLPVLFLNHPMETYYVDLATVGLVIAVGSLLSTARLSAAVVAALLGVFILVQAVAVQLYQDRSYYTDRILQRTAVLKQIAATKRPHHGELVVVTHCPLDREFSKGGELFQVLQDDPDLRVRFDFREPNTCQ